MDDAHQLGPLLERGRAGERAALDTLLGKLRPYVRLLIRPRLGPALERKLDSSDLVQESLLRVYRGFDGFAGDGVPQLLAWVGQIVGNVVASCDRHAVAGKRDRRREVDGSDLLGVLAAGSSPEERLLRDESNLPVNVDISQSDASTEPARRRLGDRIAAGIGSEAGYVLPLKAAARGKPATRTQWTTSP
jgi:DNA-directed RNA polymerase specialized sigma24 family protein